MADENEKDTTKVGTTEEKRCFIITPIGDIGSGIFRKTTGTIESAIKPVLQQIGFTDIKAAHEIAEPGSINTQIINRIFNDELVIANLTGNNPNVMYELCLRHVTAKPLITICEENTKLPFDIYDNRTIFFKDDLLGANELKEELSKVLEVIDYSKEYKDNPIYNGIKVGNVLKDISDTNTDNVSVLLQEIMRKLDTFENNTYRKTGISDRVNKDVEIEEQYFIERDSVIWEKFMTEDLIKLSNFGKVELTPKGISFTPYFYQARERIERVLAKKGSSD